MLKFDLFNCQNTFNYMNRTELNEMKSTVDAVDSETFKTVYLNNLNSTIDNNTIQVKNYDNSFDFYSKAIEYRAIMIYDMILKKYLFANINAVRYINKETVNIDFTILGLQTSFLNGYDNTYEVLSVKHNSANDRIPQPIVGECITTKLTNDIQTNIDLIHDDYYIYALFTGNIRAFGVDPFLLDPVISASSPVVIEEVNSSNTASMWCGVSVPGTILFFSNVDNLNSFISDLSKLTVEYQKKETLSSDFKSDVVVYRDPIGTGYVPQAKPNSTNNPDNDITIKDDKKFGFIGTGTDYCRLTAVFQCPQMFDNTAAALEVNGTIQINRPSPWYFGTSNVYQAQIKTSNGDVLTIDSDSLLVPNDTSPNVLDYKIIGCGGLNPSLQLIIYGENGSVNVMKITDYPALAVDINGLASDLAEKKNNFVINSNTLARNASISAVENILQGAAGGAFLGGPLVAAAAGLAAGVGAGYRYAKQKSALSFEYQQSQILNKTTNIQGSSAVFWKYSTVSITETKLSTDSINRITRLLNRYGFDDNAFRIENYNTYNGYKKALQVNKTLMCDNSEMFINANIFYSIKEQLNDGIYFKDATTCAKDLSFKKFYKP